MDGGVHHRIHAGLGKTIPAHVYTGRPCGSGGILIPHGHGVCADVARSEHEQRQTQSETLDDLVPHRTSLEFAVPIGRTDSFRQQVSADNDGTVIWR